tara:strand:- start:811 stop:1044 length:234 start_codon:yes stop_codon:yes gene_type:complete
MKYSINEPEEGSAEYNAALEEYKKVAHKINRLTDFNALSIGEQLDNLWHDIDEGKLDKTGKFYTSIKVIKDKYPKPS